MAIGWTQFTFGAWLTVFHPASVAIYRVLALGSSRARNGIGDAWRAIMVCCAVHAIATVEVLSGLAQI